jgi:hypothetical protein
MPELVQCMGVEHYLDDLSIPSDEGVLDCQLQLEIVIAWILTDCVRINISKSKFFAELTKCMTIEYSNIRQYFMFPEYIHLFSDSFSFLLLLLPPTYSDHEYIT